MTQLSLEPRAIDRWKAIDWWFNEKMSGAYQFILKYQWGERLSKALPHILGPRVLEVSFGMGYLMSLYADRFDVTGLDYNPSCVKAARRLLEQKNLRATLLLGDAHHLPFPADSFNTVVNTDAFTLYDDPQRVMREIFRVLRPGGRLVMMEYDYPRDGNRLGRLWALGAQRIIGMPSLDLNTLHQELGVPYQDYDVGAFGSFHMYVSEKPHA